jgi:hypothetical protein
MDGKKTGGMILQSPYRSIKHLAEHFTGKYLSKVVGQRWENEKQVQSITDPVLIIHGKRDNVIPYEHGHAVYEACGSKSKHLKTCAEATHNDWDFMSHLVEPVAKFLQDLQVAESKEGQQSDDKMFLVLDKRFCTVPEPILAALQKEKARASSPGFFASAFAKSIAFSKSAASCLTSLSASSSPTNAASSNSAETKQDSSEDQKDKDAAQSAENRTEAKSSGRKSDSKL